MHKSKLSTFCGKAISNGMDLSEQIPFGSNLEEAIEKMMTFQGPRCDS